MRVLKLREDIDPIFKTDIQSQSILREILYPVPESEILENTIFSAQLNSIIFSCNKKRSLYLRSYDSLEIKGRIMKSDHMKIKNIGFLEPFKLVYMLHSNYLDLYELHCSGNKFSDCVFLSRFKIIGIKKSLSSIKLVKRSQIFVGDCKGGVGMFNLSDV